MVDLKLMLYTGNLHREPPGVGLVEKVSGSFIGGWSWVCHPYIECATALSDMFIYVFVDQIFF